MSEIFQKKNYGCLWFKNIESDILKDHQGSCILSETSPNLQEQDKIFSDLKQLSRNSVYWTNLPIQEIWSLGRMKGFKPNNYFGFSLNHLVLMFCKNSTQLPDFLSLLSNSFNKIVRYWSDLDNEQMEIDLPGSYFAEHFSQPEENISLEIEEISKKSFLETMTISTWEKNNDLIKLPLFFMPSAILDYLKEQKVPTGNFVLSKNNQNNFEQWLYEKNNFWIAKVSEISFNDPNHNVLFNRLDNLALNRMHKNLDWFTKNEVLWLKSNAKIKIESVYIAEGEEEIKLPKFKNFGPLSHLSLTYQLWCASWIYFLSHPLYHPETRKKNKHTPRHSLMQSYLRGILINPLNAFNNQGYKIHSYGNGMITLWVTKHDLEQVGQIAAQFGLTSVSFMQEHLPKEGVDWRNLNDEQVFYKKSSNISRALNFVYQNDFQKQIDNLLVPLKNKSVEEMLRNSAKTILENKTKLNYEEQKFFNDLVYQQMKNTVEYLKGKNIKKDEKED